MLQYSEFLLERITSRINESFIYFSPKLRSQLKSMDDDISKEILGLEGTDVKPDVTFVDLDKEGYLSFTTMKNAAKIIKDEYGIDNFGYENKIDLAKDIWNAGEKNGLATKSRNPIKVGRLVNMILPNKYTSKELEEYVNKFKALQKNQKEKIYVVEGEEIDHWYFVDSYLAPGGSLGNSCMRNKQGIFTIYTQNTQVCRLVVITESGKLKARALVWKIDQIEGGDDKKFEYFMDRQYTINDSDVNKLRNYAEEQGWAYKTYNNHSNVMAVTFNKEEFTLDMTVKVDIKDYETYPYMDTFKTYDTKKGILYNKSDNDDFNYKGCYLLDDTDGGFNVIDMGKWSEYYDTTIPEERARYSDPMDDWIYRNDSVFVEYGNRRNRGWWPSDHDKIVWDGRNDRALHQDDCTYSDYYNEYILSDDAISVVKYIDKDGDCNAGECFVDEIDDDSFISYNDVRGMSWFNYVEDNFEDWRNHEGILSNLLTQNSKGNWIPERFATNAYPVTDDENLKILTILDAFLLGKKVDKSTDPIIIDEFDYNTNYVKDLYPKLISVAEAAIEMSKSEIDFPDEDKTKIKGRIKLIEIRLNQLYSKKFVY